MLQIIAYSSDILFCCIVISTWKDPIPGWIDNMNGPTKMQLAASFGMIRTTFVDKNKVADMVPVDTVVNAMIAAAWETSVKW
jgi:fatty acyl-CoA reductase